MTSDSAAAPRKKQRGARKQLLPVDQCGPIQTAAERALFFTLIQDPDRGCRNKDGSEKFVAMAGQFNQEYSRQVSMMLLALTCHVTIFLSTAVLKVEPCSGVKLPAPHRMASQSMAWNDFQQNMAQLESITGHVLEEFIACHRWQQELQALSPVLQRTPSASPTP